MKKLSYVFYLVLATVFTGCNDGKSNISSSITTIEGCEYFVNENAYGNSITHKGNCSNPIHKCNCN